MASSKNWKQKLAISAGSLVLSALLAYGVSLAMRSHELYDQVKSGWRGWTGKVHGSDPELGLRLVPFGRGAETFAIGPDVPSRIDAEGFRVPVDAPEIAGGAEKVRPIVLALGCSFTFGSACVAEDAYAWRVAERLHGTSLNAGLCSAGAAQMLILARKLIPQTKPDYVLVQYAPWLLERAAEPFALTNMGKIPTPFFVKSGSGIELHPPAFDTLAFDLPIAEYKATPRDFADFASFFCRVGMPLLTHDDWHSSALFVSRRFGSEPRVASEREIAAAVWPEIARICAENSARMIVVWFDNRFDGDPPGTGWIPPPWIARLGVPIAHASQALIQHLPEKTRAAYDMTYSHMRGDPPVCVDRHPNPRAHEIVADEILRAIDEGR